MISAENTRTFSSSAIAWASESMDTSKARMVANSGSFFSFMMLARMTSFLWMGPMAMWLTGMGGLLSSRRNCSRASRAPSVEACTMTPLLSVCSDLSSLSRSSCTSPLTSSRSSPRSSRTTMMGVPATARPMSGATILMPTAPCKLAWWMYSLFTLISRFGGGVSSALMLVTTGPSMVLTTMVSPSRSVPFTSTTSTVWPRPSMAFTSSTVHCTESMNINFSVKRS
mmetsp:Transcript_5462/g.7563  ORF Transcript_5462/g.7563 Transcript_5462/m.7563 type:complete len:226 (-) Transcript_5462:48-725(-)